MGARQAGYTTYRTTMPEALARGTKDHSDVQAIMVFQVVGTLLLIGIFSHGAKDPRYYFGSDRNNSAWKKYMTKRPIHRAQARLAERSLCPAHRYLHSQPKGLRVTKARGLSASAANSRSRWLNLFVHIVVTEI